MKALVKALITTLVIFSLAYIVEERETRISMALNQVFVQDEPVPENAKSYQPQKIASRKKTATKHSS